MAWRVAWRGVVDGASHVCVAGVGGGRSLFCVLILCSRKRVSLCSPNVFSSIVRPSERACKRVWLFVVSVPLVEGCAFIICSERLKLLPR